MTPAFQTESLGLLFLAERYVETCPSQRRHLILAEITYRPCDSWGKAVSKTVHMLVLITGAGPRLATQGTCWRVCSGPHLPHCRQRGEQPQQVSVCWGVPQTASVFSSLTAKHV